MNKVSCQFYVVRQTLSALHSRAYHFRAIGLLVLCLLIPIIQISVYSLKDNGFLAELGLSQVANRSERVPVGVLINERDNMSYASWAEQPKLGRYLGSDLYTTDSHSTVYFNPYFVAAGLLSKLLGISVYACMIIFSILASGLFVFAAYCIGRQVGLGGPASASAAVATAFCSGPSWALYLLHAAIGYGATDSRPFLGVDGFYFDAFPATIFIAYPYSAFNLATVAISIFLVNHAVFCGGELAWRRLAPAAAACACAILVRPYDGLLLSLLFPLCVVYRERCYPAVENGGYGRWKFSLIVSLFLLPFCAYVVCMSKLPVWRDFAKASLDSGPTRAEIFVGFAVLWVFAGCGMYRALRLRRVGMLFLSTWTITIIVMAIVMGGAMARFLGGSVLASSILAVYGIEGLRNICGGGGGTSLAIQIGRDSPSQHLSYIDL